MTRKLVLACVAFALASQAVAQTKHVTSPLEQFGFEPGTDRKLADWKELTTYYQKLASESGRIKYDELG